MNHQLHERASKAIELLEVQLRCWQKIHTLAAKEQSNALILLKLPDTGSSVDCGNIHSEVRELIKNQELYEHTSAST